MKEIAPGLYQGALWDATQGNLPDVDVVLLLTPESDRAALPEKPNVEVIKFPITDAQLGLDRWTFDKLSGICKRISDKRVLTLCFRGENRAGLASALILYHRGVSPENAVETVQRNGPLKSVGRPHSFWNAGFVRQVRSLAA